MALYESQHLRVLECLASLLDCPVPCSLKAALFQCVGAFCVKKQTVGAGGVVSAIGNQQAEITSNVWLMLESHSILSPARDGRGFVREGIVFDLEERETGDQLYPETLVHNAYMLTITGVFRIAQGVV